MMDFLRPPLCHGDDTKVGYLFGVIILTGLFAAFLANSCGSGIDPSDLARIRSVTCPSVCAAYADAVDAGVGVSPEDVALMEVCECP